MYRKYIMNLDIEYSTKTGFVLFLKLLGYVQVILGWGEDFQWKICLGNEFDLVEKMQPK